MSTSLYVGNLPFETTTDDLCELFSATGFANAEVQVRNGGRSRGFALVTYATEDAAAAAIESMNDADVGGRQVHVRFDREAGGMPQQQQSRAQGFNAAPVNDNFAQVSSNTLFVGNLPWSATDDDIQAMFAACNPISATVKIGRDGRSRGTALVAFASEVDAEAAISATAGAEMEGRFLKIRFDRGKPASVPRGQGFDAQQSSGTSVYVGNLSYDTTDDSLLEAFGAYQAVSARVARDRNNNSRSRGWGTVKFADAQSAEWAIGEMNDVEIDGRSVSVRIDSKA